MFEQAALPVKDQVHFAQLKTSLEALFSPSEVAGFLTRLKRARLRVRDFAGVMDHNLLGKGAAEAYGALEDSDRGQVRELYLWLVEKVPPELRTKFLKVYAYY